jgi:hypothetical protein
VWRPDAGDQFVAENFADLKAGGLLAGVFVNWRVISMEPCDMVRQIAHFCGSTALAFSMHTRGGDQCVALALSESAGRRSIEASPAKTSCFEQRGSDWLQGSGGDVEALSDQRSKNLFQRRLSAILMTSAIYET